MSPMVRFGRRGKRRPKTDSGSGAPIAENSGQPSQAVADALSKTLDQVLESTDRPDESASDSIEPTDDSSEDTTQQLLTSLGRFQRVLKGAHAGGGFGPWSDECMSQLVHAAELALSEGWTDLVVTLTDTGRILQSYENVGKADLSLDFLDEAYEVLCLMVGDMMVDNVRDTVRDRWGKVYGKALQELEQNEVPLVDDSGDGVVDSSEDEKKEGGDMPFDMPVIDGAVENDDGLPTLDELPPLESLLRMDKGTVPAETSEEAATDDAKADSAQEDELELLQAFAENLDSNSDGAATDQPTSAEEQGETPVDANSEQGPSRIVVDIIDRICDELGSLENLSVGARPVGLETVAGGITALGHCTHGTHQVELDRLCELMLSACQSLEGREADLDDTFTELGFAFCGVYVEAMEDGASENVQAWKEECGAWVDARKTAASSETSTERTESPSAPSMENSVADSAEEAASPVVSDQEEVFTPLTKDNVETITTTESSDAAAATDPIEVNAGNVSNQLLESAQAAALKGDGAGAKVFALQAAVSIAQQEVTRAEASLQEAEGKLKSSLESVESSRIAVGAAEESVKSAADLVAVGEDCLNDAKQESEGVAEELTALESGVAELNRQIQELQAQRDSELEKVNETVSRQQAVQRKEQEAQSELQALRGEENSERKKLEEDRQVVKDLQRQISDIETEMELARDRLTREKVSMADISQTIQHLIGGEPKDESSEREDGLLF